MGKKLLSALMAVILASVPCLTAGAAPADEPPPAEESEPAYHGLLGEYYTMNSDLVFEDPKSKTVDDNIAFDNMEDILNERTGQNDMAGVTWTGSIVAPEDGTYTLYAYSDNGVRISLDDEQILNWWVNEYDKEQASSEVVLKAGEAYNFQTDYFEYDGGSHITLFWKNDNSITQKEIIPADAFYLPSGYDGPLISKLDLSEAQLSKDEGETGGTIGILGENLGEEDAGVEIVGRNKNSLSTRVYPKVVSREAGKIVCNVPDDMKVGTYRMKVVADNTTIVSSQTFSVTTTEDGSTDRPEHPRPDWMREKWMNLNGWWSFAFDKKEEGIDGDWFIPGTNEYDQKINVPFCWESELSGIGDTEYLGVAWYQRELVLDDTWKDQQIFLNFGAVDWKCSLWVNGEPVGDHVGGYTAFEYDITKFVTTDGTPNTITLMVEDKSSYGDDSYPALVGKQGLNAPCGYTHTSGIWQTVYLEGRSKTYMDYMHANPDIDASAVQFDVNLTSEKDQAVTIEYEFQSTLFNQETGKESNTGSIFSGSQAVEVTAGEQQYSLTPADIPDQKLWNYDEANLYEGTITVKDEEDHVLDKVSTYFGQREVSAERYDGKTVDYIYVNNKPVYLSGLLDQGFWGEGIYTAPSSDDLRFDLQAMKNLNFNMIRKHLKIEDPLQYYWADKIGMFVWQDMPHATAMVPVSNGKITEGAATPGREHYEYALENMLTKLIYNHPSVISVMLFNETWGLQPAYNNERDVNIENDQGMSTYQWVQQMYKHAKELDPNIMVEDMSPCNQDHIQPTDLNTFHMYPKGYTNSKNDVSYFAEGAEEGSTRNFKFGNSYQGEPFLNSEYGGVAAYDGDWDVSWCFKYQTDILRQQEKLNGFVYTEPYDIEYERNGILTYDRREKVFGYDEAAYGGDMSINDLTQSEYVGLDVNPALVVRPGAQYSAPAVSMRWTDETLPAHTLKWRFDATDVYGNQISTGLSGSFDIEFGPYQRESNTIEFRLPSQECVGTVTVWIENESGETVAKNFANVIVSDGKKNDEISQTGENSLVLRNTDSPSEVSGTGDTKLKFTVPEDFDVSKLQQIRLLTEASSNKGATPSNSAQAQTTKGSELPSDMTVLMNGVEIDTVFLPDNPRDIRGTLTLPQGLNGGSSAGNFGYLLNLDLSREQVAQVSDTLKNSREITVTYKVKDDAEHKGGLRLYDGSHGRYMTDPSIILNPREMYVEQDSIELDRETKEVMNTENPNYSVEAVLSGEDAGILARYNAEQENGYYVRQSDNGKTLELMKADGSSLASPVSLSEGKHHVKITMFDDHIQVFADYAPEAVIDTYDYSGYTGNAAVRSQSKGAADELTVSPESYETPKTEGQSEVNYTDHFIQEQNTFDSRYTVIGDDWESTVTPDNKLSIKTQNGDKAVLKDVSAEDLVLEADISISEKNADGNIGFIFRGSDFGVGTDAANGYYAGIGIEDRDNENKGQGFVILGRMDRTGNQNWTQLGIKTIGKMEVNEVHRLRVEAAGPRLRVYLDDETVPDLDVYDDTYQGGQAAIRGFRASGTLDNLVVSTAPRYRADFENNSIAEWQTDGEWTADGDMRLSDSQTENHIEDLALVGNTGWSDLRLESDVTLGKDSLAGLIVRGKLNDGDFSGYKVVLDENRDTVQFVKTINGDSRVLKEVPLSLSSGTYHMDITAANNLYTVAVNKKEIMKVNDQTYLQGKAGLTARDSSTSFDNFEVKDQFVYEENFEEGALKGWNIIAGDFSVDDNILYIQPGKGSKMVDGYATWKNYTLSAKIKLDMTSKEKSNGGFIFRSSDFGTGQDDLRGYVAGINYNPKESDASTDQSGIELGDLRYGWRSIKNDTDYPVDPDQWYDFKVRVKDDNIAVYVNDELCYEVKDDAYQYGMFGLRNFSAGLFVKSLRVEPENKEKADPSVDTASLKSLIKMLEKMADQKDNFTADSWDKMEEQLDQAKALLDQPDLTQETVDDMFLSLLDSYLNLENGVLKTGLKAAIDYADKFLADEDSLQDYTDESIAALQEALTSAKTVYGTDYTDVTEGRDAVREATNRLIEATINLIQQEPVDKERLQKMADYAKTILETADDYTAASVKDLDEALTSAAAVLENKKASEEEVTEAYDALANALMGLVPKGDKAELEHAIAMGDKILNNADQYLAESLEGLEETLQNAKRIFDKEDATQEEVNDALKDLITECMEARLLGDVDNDGEVDSQDSAAVLRAAAELTDLTEDEKQAADVNRDGKISTDDASGILEYAAELAFFL